MDWSNERYVKLYTRDNADWLALSWQAQGFFCLLLRKVNRAGELDLGRHGARGIAAHFGGPAAWSAIEPVLAELLADGCIVVEGSTLSMPRFIEAQEAIQSATMRKRTERERERDGVTKRDKPSRNVTESHDPSRDVTTRTEQNRTEQRDSDAREPADPQTAEPPPVVACPTVEHLGGIDVASLLDELRRVSNDRVSRRATTAQELAFADLVNDLARKGTTRADIIRGAKHVPHVGWMDAKTVTVAWLTKDGGKLLVDLVAGADECAQCKPPRAPAKPAPTLRSAVSRPPVIAPPSESSARILADLLRDRAERAAHEKLG